jgi:S-DNA-T family DNA segregation ATPase FtsK/SpoIIIE
MHGIVFHRPARAYPERLPQDEIVLVAPPALQAPQAGAASWIQYLLPLFGTLGSMAFFFAYPQRSPLVLVATGGMILASVGGGILTSVLQRRSVKRQQGSTRQKYGRYLNQQRTRLNDLAARQRRVGLRLHPDPTTLAARVAQREFVWERRLLDDDFLQVRVGVGVAPLCCPVRVDAASNPLAEYNPDLLAQAHALVGQFAQCADEPVALSLRDAGTVAISGGHAATRALTRALIAQMAAAHAPEDLRILAHFPATATSEWRWLKWLPHCRRLRQVKREKGKAGELLCMLADTPDDFAELIETQLVPELERRAKLAETRHDANDRAPEAKPHMVLIVDGFTPDGPLARIPALDTLFKDAAPLGVTVLCLVANRDEEPAALQARLELNDADWLLFEETAYGGHRIEGIVPDAAAASLAEAVARALAPLTLGEKGARRDLSQDVRLLELLGLSTPDQVDPRSHWRPREREALLRVPIGVGADGDPLILDLKEAAEGGMGPHGLLIGATGSGKSELLRTLVTSLAIAHSPELISFVLADFKGGASFADLAGLPHTAGLITNIESDLTLVDRMRDALHGEQERRQRLLREAGNLDNIQQYHARRQRDHSLEPLPHLFIIVDEFAELLSNRPDFLDLFVTIGRLGRSLGMHLLLATQRLGEGRIQGLEGHLRYRICLRTFSAAESSAVINSPDAFYLPSFPGIGYFKVDTTIYRQFKTATVSAPYLSAPADGASFGLRLFTDTGRLVQPVAHASASGEHAHAAVVALPASEEDVPQTDMDVIISRLTAGAGSSGVQSSVHQVWLPPLPARLPLGTVVGKADGPPTPFGPLQVPIGLLDLPLEQAQRPFLLNFAGAGGHLALVGAPQTGKSTFLLSLVAALALTHSPRDVQIYGIDLGGGLLRGLEGLPHVGTICGKQDREQIRRLVRRMRTIIEERELLFRQRRIDTMETYRAQRMAGELADVPFGDVFLVVDDLGQLLGELDQIDAELVDIIATGLTYGVHVVVAAKRWADVRAKMRDNIGTRLELRLNDPADSEMGKAAAARLASAGPGRGVMKGGLQFQTALPRLADGDGTPQAALDALVARVRSLRQEPPAPPILMLPSLVTVDQLAALTPAPGAKVPDGVPIGMEESRLDPVYIDLIAAGPHFLILGDGECGKTTLLRGWMRALERRYTAERVQFALVDFRRAVLDFLDSPHLLAYACTPPMLKDAVERLKRELDGRMLSSAKVTLEELRNPRTWSGPHYFLFVDDYDTLTTQSSNPLAPLADLIQQGRDIGFHVVLARKVAGTARSAFEPVFQRLKETGSPGLIMSGDPQEGALLGTQRASPLPPGRGYLVRRNQRSTLIQTVYVEPAGR